MIFPYLQQGQEAQIAGLLVLLRLWRLLKLTTAITVSSEEYHETAEQREIARLTREVAELKEELKVERKKLGSVSAVPWSAGRTGRIPGEQRARGREEVEREGSREYVG